MILSELVFIRQLTSVLISKYCAYFELLDAHRDALKEGIIVDLL